MGAAQGQHAQDVQLGADLAVKRTFARLSAGVCDQVSRPLASRAQIAMKTMSPQSVFSPITGSGCGAH